MPRVWLLNQIYLCSASITLLTAELHDCFTHKTSIELSHVCQIYPMMLSLAAAAMFVTTAMMTRWSMPPWQPCAGSRRLFSMSIFISLSAFMFECRVLRVFLRAPQAAMLWVMSDKWSDVEEICVGQLAKTGICFRDEFNFKFDAVKMVLFHFNFTVS